MIGPRITLITLIIFLISAIRVISGLKTFSTYQ